MRGVKWTAHVETGAETAAVVDATLAVVGTDAANAVFVFATPTIDASWLDRRIADAFGDAAIIGCSGGGVIGGAREAERAGTAIAIAVLRDAVVDARTFPVGPGTSPETMVARLDVDPETDPAFVLLAEPFTCDVSGMISALDRRYPRAVKVGGVASGAAEPGAHILVRRGPHMVGGALLLAITGDVGITPVVAQGARPIGPPLRVSRASRNAVLQLDGRAAVAVLEGVLADLSRGDLDRFRRGPLIGLSTEPTPRAGDYLVRNLVGMDRALGAFSVGGSVDTGMTVQFHVRDATAASQDLRDQLARRSDVAPGGALLFSCLGRGAGFFGQANHDTSLIRAAFAEIDVAGFFCNGEIGPVRGRTSLHGYTTSIGLITERTWD